MTFLSGSFFVFLPILFLLFFAVKRPYRYLVLLAANYVFYAWADLSVLPLLLLSTGLTYVGGLLLEKQKRAPIYWLFFTANILILLVCKYTGFAVDSVASVCRMLSISVPERTWSIVAPVGLSFYIFQSTTYLSDIYRKGASADRNFFRYAAFVSFFPTILSGPIQKSRNLLPQLKNPPECSFEKAQRGVALLVWGYFVKVVVANRLSYVVNLVYNDYANYDGIYYLIAAVCFSFYIYCDFSSYSDMARGVASILGFDICKNFKNPYLAESLSEFWNRWHMSLNDWFVENVYIPLGGNRKGVLRKYLNIIVVFLLSGLWHGASWNYVIWGVANGVLRVGGEVLSPAKRKGYEMLRLDESGITVRTVKRIGVFFWIMLTWVFFRIPSVSVAVHVIKNMLLFQPMTLFDPSLISICGSAGQTLLLLLFTAVFLAIQYMRRKEGELYRAFVKEPVFVQVVLLALAVCICVFSAFSGSFEVNTQFIYFDF